MANYCPCCMAQIDSELSGKCTACGAELTLENRPHQLPVMTILHGRYLVGRVLGEGGFGITYIGRDLVLDQLVAIKEYFPSGSGTRHNTVSLTVRSIYQTDDEIIEKGRSAFLEEAKVVARFRNVPSVVNVNDFFMENGTSYIVMEYLDGQSLQQWLKEKGPVRDFDTLYEMLRPVMDGLEKVHQAGIIHRDISPSNLMMNKSGEIKILDFGTARGFGQEDEKSLSVVLKPGFAPVEQYRRHGKQGPWTDIYALCATIYKLLTGVTPDSSVDRIVEDTLKPPSALGAMITPKQEKALMAGLAVEPEKRIKSFTELKRAFDEANKKKTTKEPKIKAYTDNKEASKPKVKKKKSFVLIPIAAAAILLCVLILKSGKVGEKTEKAVSLSSPAVTQETDEAASVLTPEPTPAAADDIEHGFVQVATNYYHTAALCADGYVHTIGSNRFGQCNTEDWSDIVKVVVSYNATFGLRADGTVVTTYSEPHYVSEWKDIVDIDVLGGSIVGLKSDGTIVSEPDNDAAGDWENITMAAEGYGFYLGLTRSGTVVFTRFDDTKYRKYGQGNVEEWKDVVSIDAGAFHSVGLRADGTVVAAGNNSQGQCNVSSWKNIIAVSAGIEHTVGLRTDGTVVATGSDNYGECNVSEWRDVVSISASDFTTIALTSDGRILAAGNNNGELDVDTLVCNH